MFYKKRIETLENELLIQQNWIARVERECDYVNRTLSEQMQETNKRIDTTLSMIEGHDKLLQQLIPTINKQTQKYKKLEENYQMLVKVVEKIVTKIDPEWKSKTVNINKAKKGK